jgi:RNA polymerase sigma factor (sigma-70 family)
VLSDDCATIAAEMFSLGVGHILRLWREEGRMADDDPRTDGELLAAVPADGDAFAVFYRRYVRMVMALVARRARPDDVGDLVADVFASALVYRRRYDPARGSGGAWLTGIAHNKLADASRRGAVEARMCRRLGVRVPELDPADIGLDRLVSGEMLAALPAEQRRAVEARVLHEEPYEQIARDEAASEQAVRKRVSRALSALRSRFQEEP